MSLQINMNPGAAVQGGVGIGLMTSAGNPWTVPDVLALELVNRAEASPVNWPTSPPNSLSPVQAAAVAPVVLTSAMNPRQMTSAVQAALDLARFAGRGTVRVDATSDVSAATFDDSLRIGSRTDLVFPEYLQITRPNVTRAVPNLTLALSGGAASSITVNSQPGGYVGTPFVGISCGDMEPCEVYAYVDGTVNNGSVTSVWIKNPGWGYCIAPTSVQFKGTFRPDYFGSPGQTGRRPVITLSVSGGKVTGYTIVDAGARLDYTGLVPLRVKGGLHARLAAQIDATGNLTAVNIINGGAGYSLLRAYQTSGQGARCFVSGANPGYSAPMVTNYDWVNGNENIRVRGGIWNGNLQGRDSTKSVFDWNGDCFKFISCDNVRIAPTGFIDHDYYTHHWQDCWNVHIERHWFQTSRDNGCHLSGHNRHFVHEGCIGASADDIVTCTAQGWTESWVSGNIDDVSVKDVQMQGSSFALAVWGGIRPDGTSYSIDNIYYDKVRGSTLNQLLRVSSVEALPCGGVGKIEFTNVNVQGQSSFTDLKATTRNPPYSSPITVNYAKVDQLKIQLAHKIDQSATTRTPILLEVNFSGSIRELDMDLDLQWACPAANPIIYFTAGAGAAPETVRVRGNVNCGVDSGYDNYVLSFAGGKAPTKLTDISDLRVKNMPLIAGLYAAENNLKMHGTACARTQGSGADIAYNNILNVSAVGALFEGAHVVFVPISAGTLNWYGSGNRLTNGAVIANTTSHNFYPRDWSLSVGLDSTANREKLAKTAGVHVIAPGGGPYGIPNASMIVVDKDYDGNLWFTALGSGERAMVATKVAGGTGYTANDLLTVSTGTWDQAPVIKVLTVSAGVVSTVSVQFSGKWGKARPTGTLSTTGGTGTGATFTLAPL
jgi:hypothetical protein